MRCGRSQELAALGGAHGAEFAEQRAAALARAAVAAQARAHTGGRKAQGGAAMAGGHAQPSRPCTH